LDLGDRNSGYCVRDETSRIQLEQRVGTHAKALREVAHARKVRARKTIGWQTLARLARIDPELLYPVKHRSAQAQADLMMIGARAGVVRARTGLVNTARGRAKSYGERRRGCNVRNLNPEKADSLSPETKSHEFIDLS